MAGSRVPDLSTGLNANAGTTPFAQRSSLPGPIGLSPPEAMGSSNDIVRLARTSPARGDERRSPLPARQMAPGGTPKGQARRLTAAETSMASSLFGASVDYATVRIHNDEFLPFGLQPDDTAMTPNGEMYFSPDRFKEDFASAFVDARWFMHEMVHVWQYQLGYPVMARGALRIGLGYAYTLAADKQLSDYNMEAQGNLLTDYWAVSQSATPPSLFEEKHRGDLALYQLVLKDFIADPSDRKNLPG